MYRKAVVLGRRKNASKKGQFVYFVEYLFDSTFIDGHECGVCFSKKEYPIGERVTVHSKKIDETYVSFIIA